MKDLLSCITMFLFLTLWLVGVIVAKGFWSVFFSIVFFPYAYYLVVEHFLMFFKLI